MNTVNWKNLPEKPYLPLAELSRKVAADGCVLLKNEGDVLPLKKDDVISVFGRTMIDYYKSGTGSGGLVNVEYSVNILEGLLNNEKINVNSELVQVYKDWIKENPFDEGTGWAQEPWSQVEMVPDEETVKNARKKSDIAVIVLGRTAGEDRDNSTDKGSWYLTDEEEKLLEIVADNFEKTVVLLNVGNIIDMKWVSKYNIKAVMYVWQGGQEGGNAAADVLCGDVNPSGRLTDTIAKDISLYPSTKNFGDPSRNFYCEDIYVGYRYFETFAKDDVLYPFGFGLSYTDFEISATDVCKKDGAFEVSIKVKNIGSCSGREVAEVYCEAPQALLGKSARVLCGFAKTKLLKPSEEENVVVTFSDYTIASYDDSGITGNKSCYVLEKGKYNIYVGKCVRCAQKAYSFELEKDVVVCRLTEAMAPEKKFEVMHPLCNDGEYKIDYKTVSLRTVDYDNRIKDELPDCINETGNKDIKLIDVKNGKNTMEEFIAQLSSEELMCLARGEGMQSPKTRAGCAGAFGGVTPTLTAYGIPVVCVTDGPSGIRMDSGDKATSMPNGTLIACTWDVKAAQDLYEYLSVELSTHKIDSILGPGMNIHRSPLNGRNFEYFSEDPLMTGKMASAMVKGVAKYGNSATIKHFAANSQEFHRNSTDSVMSERAAREIYLKGFEIAVKEGNATSLMTSYNLINGHWSANNYELNTVILKNEWKYKGFVMTDWWPKLKEKPDEEINLKNMVEAQNDVYMLTADSLSCKDNLKKAYANGEITLGQLQRNAKNILDYAIKTHTFERFIEFGGIPEKSLAEDLKNLNDVVIIDNVKNDEAIKIKLPKTGKYLFCIEYESDEPDLSQLVISLFLNNVSAASMTVNGTKGEKKVVYRDVSTAFCEYDFKASYQPSLIRIKRVTIKN